MAALSLIKEEFPPESTAFEYQWVVEDDQMAPKLTAVAVQKLIRSEKVDAVLQFGSVGGNVAKTFCEPAKIPMLAVCGSDVNIANGSFCFTSAVNAKLHVELFLETARALGVKKLALFSLQQQGVAVYRGEVLNLAANYGIEIVADEKFIFGERDFRTLWLRVEEKHPDLVLMQALDPEFSIALIQKKQISSPLKIASTGWLSAIHDITVAEGLWMSWVSPHFFESGFEAKICAQNPAIRNSYYAAYMHDCCLALITACENFAREHGGQKPSGAQLAQALRATKIDGAFGPLSFSPQGLMSIDSGGLWVVKEGKLVPTSFETLRAQAATP